MTPQEIDALKEGRELDAEIAVHVMGWVRGMGKDGFTCLWPAAAQHDHWPYGIATPPFSTEIADAWRVVTKLLKPDWAWSIESVNVDRDGETVVMWFATFWGDDEGQGMFDCCAEAETAPLAICRCALKVVTQ